jgi:hypothetical protein
MQSSAGSRWADQWMHMNLCGTAQRILKADRLTALHVERTDP